MRYNRMTYNCIKFFFARLCVVFLLTSGIFIPRYCFSASEGAQDPQQEIKDFSVAGFGEKGKRNWDMTGKSADMSDTTIRLNDIQGNLYTDTEKVRLSADKGNFDKTEETVHLEKNVVITTDSGAKLTTDSMDWDRKKQLIETKDVVNIEKDNITSVAQGATGRPDLNKFNLEKDVRVTIEPASSEKRRLADGNEIIINCDGPLEVDYQNNVAVFNNNVTVDMRDSRIESDIMEVYFSSSGTSRPGSTKNAGMSPVGSRVNKIVARGNVRITRGGNTSYSDEAIYSDIDKKITLKGKPKLVIYSAKGMDGVMGKESLSPVSSAEPSALSNPSLRIGTVKQSSAEESNTAGDLKTKVMEQALAESQHK